MFKYKLIDPIEKADGTFVEEVEVRRPTVGDLLKQMKNIDSNGGAEIRTILDCINVEQVFKEKMSPRDLFGVSDLLAPFLSPAQKN